MYPPFSYYLGNCFYIPLPGWGQFVTAGVGMLVMSEYSWRKVGRRKLTSSHLSSFPHWETPVPCQVPWKGYMELLRSSSYQQREKEGSIRRGIRINPKCSRGPLPVEFEVLTSSWVHAPLPFQWEPGMTSGACTSPTPCAPGIQSTQLHDLHC